MIKKGREVKYLIWEAILLVCLFAAGIGIRICNMPVECYGLGAFYDAAAISNQSPVPYIPGTGIHQIYLYMLRCLFSIFGNIWQVGTIAQFVLFIAGAAVFYFAIRKVNGSIGSLLIIGIMLCVPCFLPITYAYGPQMLYFLLFSVGLYYIHAFVVDCAELEECGVIFIIQTIFTGFYAGLLIYLDLFGLVLLLPVLLLPYLMRNNLGILKGFGIFFLWIVSAALCLIGSYFTEGMLSGLTVGNVFEHWIEYSYGQFFVFPYSYISWENLLRDRHIWLGLFMAATYVSVLVYFVVYLLFFKTTRSMRELDVERLLIHDSDMVNVEAEAVEPEMLSEKAPAGVEIVSEEEAPTEAETVSEEEAPTEAEAVSEEDVPMEAETVSEEETSTEAESVTELVSVTDAEDSKPEVQLIENPLPLPKKHEKKVLDYAFQPDFEDMDYDVRVSDKDDYDIK